MIASALKLSLLGIDKWDDADRWVRNQFAESQLTDTGWLTDGHLERADRALAPLPGAGCSGPEHGATDRVIERAIGSFSGQTVTLTFPIPEQTDRVIIEKRPYTLIRRGNEVVHIDPPGRNCPLYQRGHYRQGETRWKNARRFAPAAVIPWC